MTKIKICGITNLADAQAVVDLGADMLGFVFAPSPRQVTIAQAKKIITELKEEIKLVGVFANQPRTEVAKIAEQVPLDYLQLHGEESPEYCSSFDLPVIKAFSIKDKRSLKKLKLYQVDKYLLDTYDPNQLGGTGKIFNWDLAVLAKQQGDIILAGGLNSENINQALKKVNPDGVDLSSGVEVKPGVKDQEKMKNFIRKVRSFRA
jgi:phosphoribosylanthranilate isomerase